MIRNAGGRASDDAILSLVISHKLLGTKEYFVIHHSDCGMELFTDDIMSGLLEKSLDTEAIAQFGMLCLNWEMDGVARVHRWSMRRSSGGARTS